MTTLASRMVLLAMLFALGCECESTPRTTHDDDEDEDGAFEPVELAGGVSWRAGEPLRARRPGPDGMRTAEYAVRDHPGVELAVFHFPTGEGGSVDDNVGRWLDQLTQPDGTPTRDHATIEERELDGMRTTVVDATGSFSGVRGAGAEEESDGYRLLGAIIESESGLVVFKLLGPEAGVEAARPAFEALLTSIRNAAG